MGKERIYTSKCGSEKFKKPQTHCFWGFFFGLKHEFRRNCTSKATDLKLNSTFIWNDMFLMRVYVISCFSILKRLSRICFSLYITDSFSWFSLQFTLHLYIFVLLDKFRHLLSLLTVTQIKILYTGGIIWK